jgi:ABC-2 type transport system ATP-binding protein
MHEPELLILDEPTSGLDPLMQDEFEKIVREANAEGTTVFMSSHILPEIEDICHRVGIIRAGRLAAVEEIDALKSKAFRSIDVEFDGQVPLEEFADLEGVTGVTVLDGTLSCQVVGALDPLIKAAARYTVVNCVSSAHLGQLKGK